MQPSVRSRSPKEEQSATKKAKADDGRMETDEQVGLHSDSSNGASSQLPPAELVTVPESPTLPPIDPKDPDYIAKTIEREMSISKESLLGDITTSVSGTVSTMCNRINATFHADLDRRLKGVEKTCQENSEMLIAQKEMLGNLQKGLEDLTITIKQQTPTAQSGLPQANRLSSRSSSTPNLHANEPTLVLDPADFGDDPQRAPSNQSASGFFRQIDTTTLYANAHNKKKVPLSNFKESFGELAAEANLVDSMYAVTGDELDDRFQIKFNGNINTASARANQFLLSLKLGKGKWKVQQVKDDGGNSVQIYINPDKNMAQVRKEILSKALLKILQEKIPDRTFFLSREAGIIYIDRRKLVKVVVTSEDSARLSWDVAKRVFLGIDDVPVETAFKDVVSEGGVQWS